MRTARCLGGPLHGQIVTVHGQYVEAPLYRVHNATFTAEYIPNDLLDRRVDKTTYRLKLIDIPMGKRGYECEWSYREWVLIPDWMSDESAGMAIKSLGYLFERRG